MIGDRILLTGKSKFRLTISMFKNATLGYIAYISYLPAAVMVALVVSLRSSIWQATTAIPAPALQILILETFSQLGWVGGWVVGGRKCPYKLKVSTYVCNVCPLVGFNNKRIQGIGQYRIQVVNIAPAVDV